MSRNNKIRGMTAVVLRRSSSIGQGTSIGLQARTVESVIEECSLNVIKTFVLEGVTGSIPGARTDIDEIVRLKQTTPSLQLLVVPDITRFTRAGTLHGHSLIYQLRSVGIVVYFVAEDLLVDDEMTAQFAGMWFTAAHHHARSIARGATLGKTVSYLDGRSEYAQRPPLGVDRLYSLDGEPLHILRNLSDGSQVMLDVETREVVRTFAPNPESGVPAHYLKQKAERVSFLPGSEEAVATVNLVFSLRHIDKRSFGSIAKLLNDYGVPAAMGGLWTASVVAKVCRNPVYTGVGIRAKQDAATYSRTSGNPKSPEPEPARTDLAELARRKSVPAQWRSRDEWLIRPMPQFENFLPPDIRTLACVEIEAFHARVGDPSRPRSTRQPPGLRDKHRDSAFLLKYIMTSRQGGRKMTGVLSGKSGHPVRQYAVPRSGHVKTGSVMNRRINARAVESVVLELLQALLAAKADLREAIELSLRQSIRAAERRVERQSDPARLDREIKVLRRRIATIVDEIGEVEGQHDPVMVKMRELKHQLAAKIAQRQALAGPPLDIADLPALAERVAQRLSSLGTLSLPDESGSRQETGEQAGEAGRPSGTDELSWHGPVPGPAGDADENAVLRSLLQTFIAKCEADLVTKEVTIEFAVPSWFPQAAFNLEKVGLAKLSVYRPLDEAHPAERRRKPAAAAKPEATVTPCAQLQAKADPTDLAIPMASYHCRAERVGRNIPCYRCSRTDRPRPERPAPEPGAPEQHNSNGTSASSGEPPRKAA